MPTKISQAYVDGMRNIYSSGYEPDPLNARDVLAFVLCPLGVFAPAGSVTEIQAVAELIGPAKAEAAKRWHDAHVATLMN